MPQKLIIDEILKGEIAHHYEPLTGDRLFSSANVFWGTCKGKSFWFRIPINYAARMKALTRLSRRLTRTDKSTAVFNIEREGIVIQYLGGMYFYDIGTGVLTRSASLLQCRNVLHCSMAVTANGIFFGEYGANPTRNKVPVWVSKDDGRSWAITYEFPERSIKHVHGIYTDPYSNALWIPTGDFDNECFLFEVPDFDFSKLIKHGNGLQEWRPVGLFFDPNRIVWGMDSQLQTSYLQVFDRHSREISQGQGFPGPVWYQKRFADGSAVLQTTVEIGPGSKSEDAHIFFSDNLTDWIKIGGFRKDLLPKRLFKFGVIAFAEGEQTKDDFVMFGEALKGLDGKIVKARIVRT